MQCWTMDMESQEKEVKTDQSIQEICLERIHS